MQDSACLVVNVNELNEKAQSLLGGKLFSRNRLKFVLCSCLVPFFVLIYAIAFCLTPFIFLIIPLIIFLLNASRFGKYMLSLGIVQTGNVSSSMYWKVFSRKYYCKAIKLLTLRAVLTFLWSLFIIPGCIKAAKYALAPYILIEHPELFAKEALAVSSKIMHGYKKQYIKLMSYSPGSKFLFFSTFGNAVLWDTPHAAILLALFYESVKSSRTSEFVKKCISEATAWRSQNNV